MLSKEEIEYIKQDLELIRDTKSSGTYTSYKIDQAIEYISQLESEKQKLIDKLEKRRKQNNDRYGIAIDNDEFPEMYEYSGQVEEDDHILKILKGENK